jgi:hypothetical protein
MNKVKKYEGRQTLLLPSRIPQAYAPDPWPSPRQHAFAALVRHSNRSLTTLTR